MVAHVKSNKPTTNFAGIIIGPRVSASITHYSTLSSILDTFGSILDTFGSILVTTCASSYNPYTTGCDKARIYSTVGYRVAPSAIEDCGKMVVMPTMYN